MLVPPEGHASPIDGAVEAGAGGAPRRQEARARRRAPEQELEGSALPGIPAVAEAPAEALNGAAVS